MNIDEDPRELARSLPATAMELATTNPGDALVAITRCAAESLPGVDFAAIAQLTPDNKVMVRAQTDPIMTTIDDLQTELQQGPCLRTLKDGTRIVRVDDFTFDPRWPDYTSRAVTLGVRSCRSFRLYVGDQTLGHTVGLLA